MKEQPEARAVILGEYIVRQKATVRAAAEWFGVSKSTVHKDVSERLEQIQPDLYTQVKEILEQNKQERHIRGVTTNRNLCFYLTGCRINFPQLVVEALCHPK